MDTAEDLAGLVDAQGNLIADHKCKRCGYNLRGLNREGRCPECGAAVGLSLFGYLLRYSSPEWVEKVGQGLTLILWMILVGVIGRVLAGCLNFGPRFDAALDLIIAAISFYGVWLVTEPDPSGVGEDPNLTARKVVRIALGLGLCGSVLLVMLAMTGQSESGWVLVLLPFILIGLVGRFAQFLYYERLALRIPNLALAQRAKFLRWGFTVTLGAGTVIGTVAGLVGFAAVRGGNARSLVGGFACVVVPIAIAFVVFAIMTLFLLLQLRKAVVEQASLARQTWASQQPRSPQAIDPPRTL